MDDVFVISYSLFMIALFTRYVNQNLNDLYRIPDLVYDTCDQVLILIQLWVVGSFAFIGTVSLLQLMGLKNVS